MINPRAGSPPESEVPSPDGSTTFELALCGTIRLWWRPDVVTTRSCQPGPDTARTPAREIVNPLPEGIVQVTPETVERHTIGPSPVAVPYGSTGVPGAGFPSWHWLPEHEV